jgi:hypothetical protein
MANVLTYAMEARNARADALGALLNSGYLRLYSGAKPAGPDTAITDQTLLAELRFGATAFGAAANGVITANALTGDAAANAGGTAAWFRALKSDGSSPVIDGTVGTADATLVLNTVSVVENVAVDVTAMTYTEPA